MNQGISRYRCGINLEPALRHAMVRAHSMYLLQSPVVRSGAILRATIRTQVLVRFFIFWFFNSWVFRGDSNLTPFSSHFHWDFSDKAHPLLSWPETFRKMPSSTNPRPRRSPRWTTPRILPPPLRQDFPRVSTARTVADPLHTAILIPALAFPALARPTLLLLISMAAMFPSSLFDSVVPSAKGSGLYIRWIQSSWFTRIDLFPLPRTSANTKPPCNAHAYPFKYRY